MHITLAGFAKKGIVRRMYTPDLCHPLSFFTSFHLISERRPNVLSERKYYQGMIHILKYCNICHKYYLQLCISANVCYFSNIETP